MGVSATLGADGSFTPPRPLPVKGGWESKELTQTTTGCGVFSGLSTAAVDNPSAAVDSFAECNVSIATSAFCTPIQQEAQVIEMT